MTAYKRFKVACDWPGCYAQSDEGEVTLAEARATAAASGWKSFSGVVDLCGPADKAPIGTAEWRTPQGHADAGHQPKITPAGRGLVQIACSCPWYGGMSGRGVAGFIWRSHIPEKASRPATGSEVPADG